ncbi:MAG: radical SAM protein [Patescibacteria group bacterium]
MDQILYDHGDIPIVLGPSNRRFFEKFLVILNRQGCDLDCPWCTGKETNYPSGDDALETLPMALRTVEQAGLLFGKGIISGNGEPAFYSLEDLKSVRDALKRCGQFPELLFQTGGRLFFEPEKFELFRSFTMELTRGAFDPAKDMAMRGYKRDYLRTDTFARAKIGINIALITEDLPDLLDEIERYIDLVGDRLQRITLKILNTNTRTGEPEGRWSRWVVEHAVPPSRAREVATMVSRRHRMFLRDPVRDTVTWTVRGIPLVLENKEKRYGRLHMAFNKGRLQDYLLREFSFPSGGWGTFTLRS